MEPHRAAAICRLFLFISTSRSLSGPQASLVNHIIVRSPPGRIGRGAAAVPTWDERSRFSFVDASLAAKTVAKVRAGGGYKTSFCSSVKDNSDHNVVLVCSTL